MTTKRNLCFSFYSFSSVLVLLSFLNCNQALPSNVQKSRDTTHGDGNRYTSWHSMDKDTFKPRNLERKISFDQFEKRLLTHEELGSEKRITFSMDDNTLHVFFQNKYASLDDPHKDENQLDSHDGHGNIQKNTASLGEEITIPLNQEKENVVNHSDDGLGTQGGFRSKMKIKSSLSDDDPLNSFYKEKLVPSDLDNSKRLLTVNNNNNNNNNYNGTIQKKIYSTDRETINLLKQEKKLFFDSSEGRSLTEFRIQANSNDLLFLSTYFKSQIPSSYGQCDHGDPPLKCVGTKPIYEKQEKKGTSIVVRWISGFNDLQFQEISIQSKDPTQGITIHIEIELNSIKMNMAAKLCLYYCVTLFDNADSCCGSNVSLSFDITYSCSEEHPFLKDPIVSNLHFSKLTIQPKLLNTISIPLKDITELAETLVHEQLSSQLKHLNPDFLYQVGRKIMKQNPICVQTIQLKNEEPTSYENAKNESSVATDIPISTPPTSNNHIIVTGSGDSKKDIFISKDDATILVESKASSNIRSSTWGYGIVLVLLHNIGFLEFLNNMINLI